MARKPPVAPIRLTRRPDLFQMPVDPIAHLPLKDLL
jgi:hypothetical protein